VAKCSYLRRTLARALAIRQQKLVFSRLGRSNKPPSSIMRTPQCGEIDSKRLVLFDNSLGAYLVRRAARFLKIVPRPPLDGGEDGILTFHEPTAFKKEITWAFLLQVDLLPGTITKAISRLGSFSRWPSNTSAAWGLNKRFGLDLWLQAAGPALEFVSPDRTITRSGGGHR